MPRGLLFLLCLTVAAGQAPQREPFDVAVQSYQSARNQGDFAEAAARREEARDLAVQTLPTAPQFAFRIQNIAHMYQGAGRHTQARAVVEDALSRANSLPEWHPMRIQLLNLLAVFWQQDGNLLKALSCREKG